jgi:diacylglycerol kinase family enzyme
LFLNNVSLGLYPELVRRRQHHRRRREALARIRASLLTLIRRALGITIDGEAVASQIVVVANNAYGFKPPVTIGARERLDEGMLHLYLVNAARAHERAARRFVVDAAAKRIDAAVDGEPAILTTLIEFRIAPRALRVLVPERVA